jgi:hypothetical protein
MSRRNVEKRSISIWACILKFLIRCENVKTAEMPRPRRQEAAIIGVEPIGEALLRDEALVRSSAYAEPQFQCCELELFWPTSL